MRRCLDIDQECRLMTLGRTHGMFKYFEPTPHFVAWMKQIAGKNRVYDVGAGAGHSMLPCWRSKVFLRI